MKYPHCQETTRQNKVGKTGSHWFSGALFIPSLALALGIWSKGQKLFEVLYISLWYMALNKVYAADYLGASGDGNIGFFIPLSIA